jgi:CHAT domain-containing protein
LFSNYRDVPWLARRHAVTVLPSVASLRTLRDLPAGRPGRETLVAFADPLFGDRQPVAPGTATGEPAVAGDLGAIRGVRLNLRAGPGTESLASAQLAMLPRLPETADEVRAIALALHADPSKLFFGADASEERVKTMDLSGVKVLAFATHGLVPGDLDGLTQPALALSSPRLSGTEGDGLLTMGEILGLKLDADWVVLSACNTGAGAGAGAEAVSGLGRAFFYAGSRALLVSNWPVHSASAKDLTTNLFRRQAENPGLGRGEALRQAMVELIDGDGLVDAQGRIVFSYAHPLFWAPFTLVGDGGGTPGA